MERFTVKLLTKVNILLIVLFVLVSPKLIAQDGSEVVAVKSLNKAKLYLFGLGIEREQKISRLSTIYIGASVENVVPFLPRQPMGSSDVLRIDYAINIAPMFQVGYKNYYNLDHRKKIGKKISNNSASFVGVAYSLVAPILINMRYTTKHISSFSPIWGFQKSLASRTHLELSAGPSFQTDFVNHRVSGFAKFGVTFLL